MVKKAAPKQKHRPQRMCVVCRERFDKRRLTRIVNAPENGVIIDPTGKMNGRGAYLCDQPSCWQRAINEESLLNQALKCVLTQDQRDGLAANKPVADLLME